ncbi:LysR family transcriptional regulator [uncultured Deefgea sp.]|uniref:LysR family transcriptional regulator n=1 Tax=uncultured Deefgea sp. TaxID=1304914 RepID=UPI002622B64B|nr:LysR family transcriptional regulator [uncultured Deefgea sp.]
MVDKIDLKHMRIFLQLVRAGNVSKVAEETGVSQQAISGYLKRLRAAFPHELFLRQSSGLLPTDFALGLATKFEKILLDVDDLFDDRTFDAATSTATFRLIANEYAQLAIIPRLSNLMAQAAPGVKLLVTDFNPRTHEASLASGDADLLIGFAEFVSAGVVKTRLKKEQYSWVVGKNSQISSHIHTVSDLQNHAHVGFANGAAHLADNVDAFLQAHSVSRQVMAVLPCYTSLIPFLEFNDVVALVPSALARSSYLNILSLDAEMDTFDVTVGWHRRSSGSSARKWLTNLVQRAADCSTA